MTRTENIEKVRAACIAANPEIEKGCQCFACREHSCCSDLRPIRLADVLLAIGLSDDLTGGGIRGHGISSDGRFTKLFGDAGESGCNWLEIAWNLRADRLDEQSDECVAFLGDLLK